MPKVVLPFDVSFKDYHGPGEFDVSDDDARVLLLGNPAIMLAAGETFDPTAPPAPTLATPPAEPPAE